MWKLKFAIILVTWNIAEASGGIVKNDFHDTLHHLKPRSTPEVQAEAARKLIERYVGEKVSLFTIVVDSNLGPLGKDTFRVLSNSKGHVSISGTSGVAAAWGFNYFIKKYCNSHIAWEGSRVEIPNVLPQVNVTVTSNDKFRYYQNVCTVGYSSTWWQWDQWERNIDWMALNGINLALAFHAQEAIWMRVYLEMGLTVEDLNEFFGGPAFLPWARMGNIRGWGGPLTSSWHEHTLLLQHLILNRMREIGIIPVLPAFAGHVPRALTKYFPTANVSKNDPWNHFTERYCCPFLLSPTDPLFKTIGGKFLRAYTDEFGTDHIYNCDTFNENEPQDSDLSSLRNIGKAIFAAMTDVDPQAIWLMQGWMFVNEFVFWTKARVEAFVTSVPIGRMIVLDLQSEQFPQYTRLNFYYGQPFIWCMLHNFGGTLGMFGSADIINTRPFEARSMTGSTMIGMGLTPEGINQNYVIYELMNEMFYRKTSVNLQKWFDNYATRRYGSANEQAIAAWRMARKTVYNFSGITRIRGHYVVTRRPSLNIKNLTWYKPGDFMVAWDNLTSAGTQLANSSFYRHDLIDFTRQALQLNAEDIYNGIKAGYRNEDRILLFLKSLELLMLFDDLERILASSENFLVGKWIKDAKILATNNQEEKNYEYNARNQITLWGPNGEIRDYAIKQWSGVVRDYLKQRWSIYLDALLTPGFNSTYVNQRIFDEVERPFSTSTSIYTDKPKGDCVAIAVALNSKWRELIYIR